MNKLYLTLVLLFAGLMLKAQIAVTVINPTNAIPNLSASYTSLANALTAVNASALTGPVILRFNTSSSETAPATGFTIGSATLNASFSSTNTLTLQRNSAGAVTINAGTGSSTPGSAAPDGILKLTGADWVTIDGLTFTDGNATNNATMEFGIGLFKLNAGDGCNHNQIKSCIFNMQRINNAAGTAPLVDGSVAVGIYNSTASAATTPLTISTAAGANSFNAVTGCTINNGNIGVAVIGFADASPYTYADHGNTIGGALASANSILNFGGGAATSPAAAVRTLAQYDLDISYNTINNNNGAGVNHATTLRGIFVNTAAGAAENISNNTITLTSGAAASQLIAIENQGGGGVSGNTVTIDGNTISTSYPGATSGLSYGIYNNTNPTNISISTNNVSLSSGTTTGSVYPIFQSAGLPNITLSGNTISATLSSVTSSNVRGIVCSAGSTTGTTNISNNIFTGFSFTNAAATAGSGEVDAIYHIGTPLNCTISNNEFRNLSIKTTGAVYLINNDYAAPANGTKTIQGNFITTAVNRTGTASSNAFYCYYDASSSGTGTTRTISGNTFSNINTNSSGGNFGGIYDVDGGASVNANVYGNTVSNITAGGSTFYGVYIAGFTGTAGSPNQIYGNTISTVTATNASAIFVLGQASAGSYVDVYNNTVTGISAGSPVQFAGLYSLGATVSNVYGNNINGLSFTGGTGSLNGMVINNGTTLNLYKNKIYNLSAGTATAALVNGINLAPVTTANVYNNYIGDLRNTAATNAASAVIGFYIPSTSANTSVNFTYNTIYLAAASTGTNFSTSCLYAASSATATNNTMNMRNNILVNLSTPNGTGISAAYRRSTTTLTNYGSVSNNNLLYAGTASATHLLFYDGTNSDQTITTYRTRMSPRDNLSVTENPTFLSTSGASASFLHLSTAVASLADGGGVAVAGITDDYDGDIRNTGAPDIGADEYSSPNNVRVSGSVSGVTADYATLKAGFDAINAGTHTGSIIVTVFGNTTETASASLNASGAGSASYTAVSIVPGGARTVSGTLAAALVDFNGADNVILNGIGSGGNSFTFNNLSASASASTIRFINDASNNIVENSTIIGASAGSNTGTVFFSTGTTTGNDGNSILGNTITAGTTTPYNAVFSLGSSTTVDNSSDAVDGNYISDYFSTVTSSGGVVLSTNNSGWEIADNSFYQTAARTTSAFESDHAIYISSAGGTGFSVTGNVIGYANSGGTGTTTYALNGSGRFSAIELSVGSAAPSYVQNNIITAISITGTGSTSAPGLFNGILISGGAVDVGGSGAGNIIGALSGTGSISVSENTGSNMSGGIYVNSSSSVKVTENYIGSVSFTSTVAGGNFFLYGITLAGTGSHTATGNMIGNGTADNYTVGTVGFNTGNTFAYGIQNISTGTNVTIGSAGAGNIIQNMSSNGSGTSTVFYGIYNTAAVSTLDVNYNEFSGNNFYGSGLNGGSAYYCLIYNTGAVTTSININHNSMYSATISSAAYIGGTILISNNAGGSAATLAIDNNYFTGLSDNSTSNLHPVRFIYNDATVALAEFDSNEFSTLSFTGTNGSALIYSAFGSTPVLSAADNFTSGNISVTGAGSTNFTGIQLNTSAGSAGSISILNNTITNITSTNAFSLTAFNVGSGTTVVQTVSGNTVSNMTTDGGFFGVGQGLGAAGSSIHHNTISAVSAGGIIYGISFSLNACPLISCYSNDIHGLSNTGTSPLHGIYIGLGTDVEVYKNKLYDFTVLNSGAVTEGIDIENTTNSSVTNVYNNIIGDLKAPNANSTAAIYGIKANASGTNSSVNAYHNTVYLNASSTGANFGTAALYQTYNNTATINTLTSNNNILVNTSTPAGSGYTAAFRRSTFSNLNNYSSSSNNNLFYAGNVTSGSNFLYFDGTSAYATLARLHYYLGGVRESNSVSDMPSFLSTVGSNANFLHINPAVDSRASNGGINIPSVTDDYDGTARSATSPDIGADEFTGITKDSTGPVITINQLIDSCNGGRRIRATITDVTGIPLSGTTMPRIWYKKNAGAYQNAAGTLVSGTATNSIWDFTIDPAVLSGVVTGDVISYFIIAEDNITLVPNVSSNPSSGLYADDVNSIIKDPTVTSSYTVGNVYTAGTWVGTDQNWFLPSNWCGGVVPVAATNVIIPASAVAYPLISSGNATCNNISVASGASVTVNGTGIFSLNGAITNSGTFDITVGTLDLAGSSVSVGGGSILNATVKNITVNNNASVTSGAAEMIRLTGDLSFGNVNAKTFTTNGNLTLVSSATTTASIKDITNNGANSGNSISGNAVVERYIPSGRKWRFLAINTNSNFTGYKQTMQANWMEGQTPGANAGPAGYGMWITDAAPATGFDAASVSPTIKWWDGSVYTGITNPTTYDIRTHDAYMTFVRGDRSSTGSNAVVGNTVLRTTGGLTQGTTSAITVPAGSQWIAVGNPYASAVDLTKLIYSHTAVINISIWDPNLGGGNGLGAFQYLSKAPAATDFTIIPGGGSYGTAGSVMNAIESGQAFFIQGSASPRDVSFREIAKTPKEHDVFFTDHAEQRLSADLYAHDADSSILLDGTAVKFKENYHTAADPDDARKMQNGAENISVKRGNELFAIEYRNIIDENDTVNIHIAGMHERHYYWKFNVENMDAPGRTGFLGDRLNHSLTALDLAGETIYEFEVTNDPASSAADRFYIVFKPSSVVPVTLTTIEAVRQKDESILVKWHSENETGIQHYEIQRSDKGVNFTSIGNTLPANNNSGSASYNYTDSKPLSEDNYYRIKSIGNVGQVQYSSIVKVDALIKGEIIVSPNPVADKIIHLKLLNQQAGDYSLQLINNAGQIFYKGMITVNQSAITKDILLKEDLAPGIYQLVIAPEKGKETVLKVQVR